MSKGYWEPAKRPTLPNSCCSSDSSLPAVGVTRRHEFDVLLVILGVGHDILNHALIIEDDGDDLALEEFGLEESGSFRTFGHVVPDVFAEDPLGRRCAQSTSDFAT